MISERARALGAVAAVACLTAIPAFGLQGAEVPEDQLRVFAEPLASQTFVQYSVNPATGQSQYLDGIAEVERRYPKVVEVDPIGDLVGRPGLKSAGGREIPVITVTDESVPDADKVDLYFSMSIHGPERAGLEGGVRFLEDIAMGWYREQGGGEKFVLANGDPKRPYYRQMTATEVLRKARLLFVAPNPDGWVAGDVVRPGAVFKRGNDGVSDLNRQFPTLGWHNASGSQYNTASQPESQGIISLVEDYLGVPEGAADLHGELNDDVLLAIMFPAGQFDPLQLAKEVELAEAIKYNVNNSVFPGAKGLLNDQAIKPAEYHTAYDAIGYDDAGFQGDWLVQQGILEMDHEYLFSHIVPGNAFIPAWEQVHVDTTRELLKATIVTTIVAEEMGYTADLKGTAGYVRNPEVLRSTDPGLPRPPFGLPQKPYESTSMQYYADLAQYTTEPLVAVGSDKVAAGFALDGLDTVVVTDRDLPAYETGDGGKATPDRAAFWGALRRFAEGGGNVVLTDSALQGLVDMGIVPAGSVARTLQYAGRIQNIDRSHPLLSGVTGVIGQTYFEVPLGYRLSPNSAPGWHVNTSQWSAKGGTTAATISNQTALGTLPLGKGRVTIFGAVLPNATQAYPHTHGLADYAVTYAGNAILVNALTWERPAG